MDLTPSAWQLWLLLGLVTAVLDIKLSGFVLIWFALGAFAAALAAGLGLGLNVQLVTFTVISAVLFLASRTIFKSFFMRGARRIRTGVENMIGAEAVVVEPLAEENPGTVRINGELWIARSMDGPVPAGRIVLIEDQASSCVRQPSNKGNTMTFFADACRSRHSRLRVLSDQVVPQAKVMVIERLGKFHHVALGFGILVLDAPRAMETRRRAGSRASLVDLREQVWARDRPGDHARQREHGGRLGHLLPGRRRGEGAHEIENWPTIEQLP